ncbi:hypothetical protein WJX75_005625 [Coccomyxa subellipsoidea]|uniref:Uncharacterized protein n=1 Tax=Coccomyxa subellipsoidea TaxID=248742 RepID=A0ABR2YAK6_9CHLO
MLQTPHQQRPGITGSAQHQVQAAGAEGIRRKKRRLVKERDLTVQARNTRAKTASQKGGAAAESSDADDRGSDGDAADMSEIV